jgi:hypothetical protein
LAFPPPSQAFQILFDTAGLSSPKAPTSQVFQCWANSGSPPLLFQCKSNDLFCRCWKLQHF